MKTQFTFGRSKIFFGTVLQFFIYFLFSLNLHSQKILTSLTEFPIDDTWENVRQTLNTYDNNGYLIQDLTQVWDSSWKNDLQTYYANNPDGTVQQSISQYWNTMTNGWENSQRASYTYSATKKVLTSEIWGWENKNWVFNFKQTNIYDENDYLLISNLTYGYQTIYTNNPDGTVKQSITQMFINDGWRNSDRITYTYDNSKLIKALSEKWETEFAYYEFWKNYSLDTYDYDGNGYLIHSLSQKWLENSWKNDFQYFITNYESGTPFQIIYQYWHTMYLVWTNESRTTLTYTSLAVEEHAFEKSFSIYPNPAQDRITIKTNDISLDLKYLVFDSSGRQLLNGTLTDIETVIYVNQLATGIYFIKISGHDRNQTIKMIKK